MHISASLAQNLVRVPVISKAWGGGRLNCTPCQRPFQIGGHRRSEPRTVFRRSRFSAFGVGA